MHSNYPLIRNVKRDYDDCFSFAIRSRKIYNDIIKLGGQPRKSLNSVFPRIPKKYLSDFIRGFFDGDGSIYLIKRRACYGATFSCSSKKFITTLKTIIENNVKNIQCSLSYYIRNDNKHYSLRFNKRGTFLLGRFMYKNLKNKLKMDRKFKLFQLAKETNK
jgi:intein-encoded DNA endonuclease-like protein